MGTKLGSQLSRVSLPQKGLGNIQSTSSSVPASSVHETNEIEDLDSFGAKKATNQPLPSHTGQDVIRPSKVFHSLIEKVASKLETWDGDKDLHPDVFWNTNAPISHESRTGQNVSVSRDYTDQGVTTTHTTTTHRGTESDSVVNRTGPTVADDPSSWERPFDVNLGGWWKDTTTGKGVGVRGAVSKESGLGSAEVTGAVFSEIRNDYGVGGRASITGVEGGVWARNRMIALGEKTTASIHSPKVTIAGKEIDAHVKVASHSFIGTESAASVWTTVDAKNPAVGVSVGGSTFIGAKSRNWAGFGLGDLMSVRLTGEAWAGAGADASVSASIREGKVSLGASAGAALGVGGKVGIQVDVDVAAGAKMLKHAADRDGDGKLTLNDPAAGVAQGMNAVAGGLEKGVDGVISALDADHDGKFSVQDLKIRASQTGEAISKGVKGAANGIAKGAKKIASATHGAMDIDGDGRLGFSDISAGFRKVGDALGSGGKKTGQVASALGRGIAMDIQDTPGAVKSGAKSLGQAVANFADRDGDGTLSGHDLAVGAKETGQAIHDGAVKTGEALKKGAKATGRAISQGAKFVGRGLHRAADRDGDGRLSVQDAMLGVSQAGGAVVDGVQSAGKAIARGTRSLGGQLSTAGTTLADGTKKAYKRAKAAIHRLGQFFT